MTRTTATPGRCPRCQYDMDAATTVDGSDAVPKCGDYSICFNCAALLVFNDELRVRGATFKERRAAGPEVDKAIADVEASIKHRKGLDYEAGAELVHAAVRDWAARNPFSALALRERLRARARQVRGARRGAVDRDQ